MMPSTLRLGEMDGPEWAGKAEYTAASTATQTIPVRRKARGQFPKSPAGGLIPMPEGVERDPRRHRWDSREGVKPVLFSVSCGVGGLWVKDEHSNARALIDAQERRPA